MILGKTKFVQKCFYRYLDLKIKIKHLEAVPNITSNRFSSTSCDNFLKSKCGVMLRPRILLLSSSKVHGFGFLEYASHIISRFFQSNNVSTVLFVPYASTDHDGYLNTVTPFFTKIGLKVEGIHQGNPIEAVKKAEAIFVGGGNTFLLLKSLYDHQLINIIRKRVLEDGVPYMGSSAGTNVAAPSIHNTNDMPIVYPPSFSALNLIPLNINPHYVDPDAKSTHKGETREERIAQYHELPPEHPVYNVLGLREGAILLVEGNVAVLQGVKNARLFVRGKPPQEIELGGDLSYLFNEENKCLRVAQN